MDAVLNALALIVAVNVADDFGGDDHLAVEYMQRIARAALEKVA